MCIPRALPRLSSTHLRYSLVVRILGPHPSDPGSSPGGGIALTRLFSVPSSCHESQKAEWFLEETRCRCKVWLSCYIVVVSGYLVYLVIYLSGTPFPSRLIMPTTGIIVPRCGILIGWRDDCLYNKAQWDNLRPEPNIYYYWAT